MQNANLTGEKKVTIWNRTFICCIIANVCLCMSQFVVNPLVTSYATFLGAGATVVGMISGLYFGISFAMRPISGPMVTMMDKKKLMIFAYALGVAVNLAYATFNTIGLFVAARLLHGVQFSLIGSLTLTVASDSLPKEKMGSGIGIFGVGGAFGTALGPSVGLALRTWGNELWGDGGGFRLTFLAAAGFMVISLIPCFLMTTQPKPDRKALAALGPWYKNIVAVDALPPAVLMALYSMAFILYNTYMVPYSEQFGIAGIGSFFTVYALVLLVSRPLSGRLLDKYGAAVTLYPCSILFILSFVIVGLVHSLPAVLAAAALAGAGWGAIQPTIQAMSIQSVSPAKRGVASNTNYFGMDLGYFLGPTLGGLIVANVHDYSKMFLCGIIPVVLGLIVFIFTWRRFKVRAKVLEHKDAPVGK
ncbi:MAG: MFS transporter [Oscillospiraceae bacterium]|nr:MFS transporter [Oscillospiraceae bacterium]